MLQHNSWIFSRYILYSVGMLHLLISTDFWTKQMLRSKLLKSKEGHECHNILFTQFKDIALQIQKRP